MADEMVFIPIIGRPFWASLILVFTIFATAAVIVGFLFSLNYAVLALIIVIAAFAMASSFLPRYIRYIFKDDCLEVKGYGTTCIPYNSIVCVNETDSLYNDTFGWLLTIDR